MLETSEDDEAKKKEAEKAKTEKSLTEKQLMQEVAICLSESDTLTIFFIPSMQVPQQDHLGNSDEYVESEKRNKLYAALCAKKISSDAFIDRGSQTMNPTQKTREIDF